MYSTKYKKYAVHSCYCQFGHSSDSVLEAIIEGREYATRFLGKLIRCGRISLLSSKTLVLHAGNPAKSNFLK